ncbi:MAG: hypothetical protein ACMXYD_01075 [Candidatus Woesearchaeota archaeon]
MREKTLLFVVVLLLSVGVVSATFTAEVVGVQTSVLPGEVAVYNVVVTNDAAYSDRYTLSVATSMYNLFVTSRPDGPIASGQQGMYTIEVSPVVGRVGFGSYLVPLEVRSQATREVKRAVQDPFINVRNPDAPGMQYSPSIALSVSAPEVVDPRNDLRVSVGLRNRNARSYTQEELSVRMFSEFFDESYNTSLGRVGAELGEKTTPRVIALDDYKSPGEYRLTVQVLVNGVVVSEHQQFFEILSFSDVVQVVAVDQSLFKTTTTYYLTNDGNTASSTQVAHPSSRLSSVFTRVSHSSDVVVVDGDRLLVSEVFLESQEEVAVTVTRNYRLLVLLFLLAIVAVVGYYLLRSPLVLEKEAEVTASVDDSESEVKTRLLLKNRGSQTLRNVRVVDRVSGLADVVEKDQLGTLRPTKVVKKKGQGTLIRWDIEALEPFEERIISYTVHTPLALVGDVDLPSLKVTFEQENGRSRTSFSNDVNIRRNE